MSPISCSWHRRWKKPTHMPTHWKWLALLNWRRHPLSIQSKKYEQDFFSQLTNASKTSQLFPSLGIRRKVHPWMPCTMDTHRQFILQVISLTTVETNMNMEKAFSRFTKLRIEPGTLQLSDSSTTCVLPYSSGGDVHIMALLFRFQEMALLAVKKYKTFHQTGRK